MSITRVSRKGQITIHEDVRRKLGICPGDLLEEKVRGDKIVLTVSTKPSTGLRGIGKKTRKKLEGVDSVALVRRMRTEDEEEI